MRGIKRKYTKDYILSKVTEVEIFSFYFSQFNKELTVRNINYLSETGIKISNPLRLDKNPSMGFKHNNRGKLKVRDFAGYLWGDAFDLVAYLIKVSVESKIGFVKVLKKIAADMDIDDIEIDEAERLQYEVPLDVKVIRNRPYRIEPVIRDWNEYDMEYWNNRGISVQTLIHFKVFPVASYYADRESQPTLKYTYDTANPAYAYYNGVDANNVPKWDIYFPNHKKYMPKFIKSHMTMQGTLSYNPKAEILIMIKSLKDAMAVHELIVSYFKKHTVTFIVPPSESISFTDRELEYFVNNHQRTYVLYDFDRIGIVKSNEIRRAYPVTQLFFTNGKYNSFDYGHKDFTDYYFKRGRSNVFKLVNEILKEYEEHQMGEDAHEEI